MIMWENMLLKERSWVKWNITYELKKKNTPYNLQKLTLMQKKGENTEKKSSGNMARLTLVLFNWTPATFPHQNDDKKESLSYIHLQTLNNIQHSFAPSFMNFNLSKGSFLYSQNSLKLFITSTQFWSLYQNGDVSQVFFISSRRRRRVFCQYLRS